jgi:hypothetical protein
MTSDDPDVSQSTFIFLVYLVICSICAIVFIRFEMPWQIWLERNLSYVGCVALIIIMWSCFLVAILSKKSTHNYFFVTLWTVFTAGFSTYNKIAPSESITILILTLVVIAVIKRIQKKKRQQLGH